MAGAIIVCLKFVLIAVVSEILPEVDARRIQQDMEMVDTDIASNHRQTELEHRQAELEHRQAELDVNLLRNILLRATMIPRKNNDSIVMPAFPARQFINPERKREEGAEMISSAQKGSNSCCSLDLFCYQCRRKRPVSAETATAAKLRSILNYEQ